MQNTKKAFSVFRYSPFFPYCINHITIIWNAGYYPKQKKIFHMDLAIN